MPIDIIIDQNNGVENGLTFSGTQALILLVCQIAEPAKGAVAFERGGYVLAKHNTDSHENPVPFPLIDMVRQKTPKTSLEDNDRRPLDL